MQALKENPLWLRAGSYRNSQRFFGIISGILLACAMIALFDGLLAQMRQGANELELLPGQALTLSGPAVLKNPLASDLVAAFRPAGAPLEFELEGFFTGYWFGNGMWRGKIVAEPGAEAGRYELRISFKGASARTAQNFVVKIFENMTALRDASLSLIRRYLDINPFILAASCGLAGIIAGILTYLAGSRYVKLLLELGLAEIYSEENGVICCLVPKSMAPMPGNERELLDSSGNSLGKARVTGWKKGRLRLVARPGQDIPARAIICLAASQ